MLANFQLMDGQRNSLLERTETYISACCERILPLFDDLEGEARRVQTEAYQTMSSDPESCEFTDPEDLAEAAIDVGLNHYESLCYVREQIIGLAIAGLYHLLEKNLRSFLLQEFQNQRCQFEDIQTIVQRWTFEYCMKLMRHGGFDIRNHSFGNGVEDLMLVANSVKHSSGPSLNRLLERRPDLFANSYLDYRDRFPPDADHLRLNDKNLIEFGTAVMGFWNAFPSEMQFDLESMP